jgi:hypothetical protein
MQPVMDGTPLCEVNFFPWLTLRELTRTAVGATAWQLLVVVLLLLLLLPLSLAC